jgi:hypothetical protein
VFCRRSGGLPFRAKPSTTLAFDSSFWLLHLRPVCAQSSVPQRRPKVAWKPNDGTVAIWSLNKNKKSPCPMKI